MPVDDEWGRQWEARVSKSPTARIWWTNYQFDKKNKNLPEAVIERFEARLRLAEARASRYEANRPRLISPLVIIQEAIAGDPSAFELKGVRAPARTEKFSCLIDACSFARHYVRGLGVGKEMTERCNEVEVWEKLGNELTADSYTGAWLRSSRAFFWCTPSRCIDKIRADFYKDSEKDKIATEARNRLGLNHHDRGTLLFQIMIPAQAIKDNAISAPTSLDANADNPVFTPSNDKNGWGWTMHLITLLTGVEELVGSPIRFTEEFEVTRLGNIIEPSPIDLDDPLQLERIEARARDRL